MLTVLALVFYFLRFLKNIFLQKWSTLPPTFYVGTAGFLVAVLFVQLGTFWPIPTDSLDIRDLVSPGGDKGTAPPPASISQGPVSAAIPPELYRESEIFYDSRAPILVTTRTLPSENWRILGLEGEDADGGLAEGDFTDVEGEKAKSVLPRMQGVNHVVQPGENLWEIAQAYKDVTYEKVIAYNPNVNPRRMMPGDKIFIPGARESIKIAKKSYQGMRLPINNNVITSGYGMRTHPIGGGIRFHHGVDFRATMGEPIYAVLPGTVVFAGWRGKQGQVVEIQHTNGLRTIFCHTSKFYVKSGETVARGQLIARVGSTGYATGPHLHFEVWKGKKSQDPIAFLPPIKVIQ